MLGVVQALMPLMDGLFINNISGTLVASAVTFSEPVINMMTALSQGLSVADMAIIGQLNGRGNFAESKRTLTQIVVAGSILGCLSAPPPRGSWSPHHEIGQCPNIAQRIPLSLPLFLRASLRFHGGYLQRHQERERSA